MTRTATAISTKTGLDHVIEPIHSGITNGVGHVSSGVAHVSSGVAQVSSGVASGVASKMGHMGSMAANHAKSFRRQSKHWGSGGLEVCETSQDELSTLEQFRMLRERDMNQRAISSPMCSFDSDLEDFLEDDDILDNGLSDDDEPGRPGPAAIILANQQQHPLDRSDGSKSVAIPDQDIDIEGPSSGKKLTEDLAEARDKMHELTWHRFNDHTYILKNRNSLFFDESKKPEKWRKKNTSKQMDRYLHMGKYSHNNPFVARVGTYVQPIVSSIYGILGLFRSLFNVVTWRDPFLSFLLSFFFGVSSIVLFFFPWRIFLFFVGFFVVGPQNWAIRILREQGHLPPLRLGGKATEDMSIWDEVPKHLPIFTAGRRKQGNDPRTVDAATLDAREIHHVVVPYGPLIHQRCNDWPPEAKYAQVSPEQATHLRESKGFLSRRRIPTDADFTATIAAARNRTNRLRRRLPSRNEHMQE